MIEKIGSKLGERVGVFVCECGMNISDTVDVQKVCDHIGILRRGEMVYQGSLDDLLRRYVSNGYDVGLRSGARDVKDTLLNEPWVRSVEVGPNETLSIAVSDVAQAESRLVQVLAGSGCAVVFMTRSTSSLEQVFLEVTQ